jgi:hypothetical protein
MMDGMAMFMRCAERHSDRLRNDLDWPDGTGSDTDEEQDTRRNTSNEIGDNSYQDISRRQVNSVWGMGYRTVNKNLQVLARKISIPHGPTPSPELMSPQPARAAIALHKISHSFEAAYTYAPNLTTPSKPELIDD